MSQLRQGLTPEGLALSCALGVACGLLPLFGLTTLLGLVLGHFLKANHAALQAVNYLMGAVQLLMIPVSLYLGSRLFGVPMVSFDPRTAFGEFFTDIPLFFRNYGEAALHACAVWLFSLPIFCLPTYYLTRTLFRRWRKQS